MERREHIRAVRDGDDILVLADGRAAWTLPTCRCAAVTATLSLPFVALALSIGIVDGYSVPILTFVTPVAILWLVFFLVRRRRHLRIGADVVAVRTRPGRSVVHQRADDVVVGLVRRRLGWTVGAWTAGVGLALPASLSRDAAVELADRLRELLPVPAFPATTTATVALRTPAQIPIPARVYDFALRRGAFAASLVKDAIGLAVLGMLCPPILPLVVWHELTLHHRGRWRRGWRRAERRHVEHLVDRRRAAPGAMWHEDRSALARLAFGLAPQIVVVVATCAWTAFTIAVFFRRSELTALPIALGGAFVIWWIWRAQAIVFQGTSGVSVAETPCADGTRVDVTWDVARSGSPTDAVVVTLRRIVRRRRDSAAGHAFTQSHGASVASDDTRPAPGPGDAFPVSFFVPEDVPDSTELGETCAHWEVYVEAITATDRYREAFEVPLLLPVGT